MREPNAQVASGVGATNFRGLQIIYPIFEQIYEF